MSNKKTLNLGCGKDIRKECINMDIINLPGVDVVHDIEKLPLPFEAEEFDEIICMDILEHIEYTKTMKELHRILKKGGTLKIRVPHFTSRRNFNDPTHKKMFSIKTFQFFTGEETNERAYYFDYHFEAVTYSRIIFDKKPLLYNYIVEMVVNSSRRLKETIFESTFLSRLFPADLIRIDLKK